MKKCLLICLLLILFPKYSFGYEPEFIPGEDTPVPGSSPESFDLLFIGNSHSAANGLPQLVTTLLEAGLPEASASSGLAPGYSFLADRLNDGVTEPMLNGRSWTHVVLQAQKYSSSGLYHYPTDAAEEWIRRVKDKKARPLLFPEWPRRGNDEEGLRVHNLHLGIASRESACVAPVGLVWEAALEKYPGLVLHASDGNHSSLHGALLTAYVFYELVSGQAAANLQYVPSINVSAEIQNNLAEVASEVIQANSATCSESSVAGDPAIPTLGSWALFTLALSLAAAGRASLPVFKV
jgi:hypothetical protein